jgi:hypothetical protein
LKNVQAVANRFKRIQFTSFSPLEKIGKVAKIHHQPKERKRNKNTSHVTLGHQTCVHLDFSLPLPSKLATSNSLDLPIVEEKIW